MLFSRLSASKNWSAHLARLGVLDAVQNELDLVLVFDFDLDVPDFVVVLFEVHRALEARYVVLLQEVPAEVEVLALAVVEQNHVVAVGHFFVEKSVREVVDALDPLALVVVELLFVGQLAQVVHLAGQPTSARRA